MKEFNRRQGNQNNQESIGQSNSNRREAGKGSPGFRARQPEQAQPQQEGTEDNFLPLSPEEQQERCRPMNQIREFYVKDTERYFRDLEIMAANIRPLSPEEQREKSLEQRRSYYQENKEKILEQARRAYKRRKERHRIQADKPQPSQVFPPPAE
jgi:hypothetical protein